jgi:hypothetical protein
VTDTEKDSDAVMAEAAGALLREQATRLDGATAARLAKARHAALAALPDATARRGMGWTVGLTTALTAAAVVGIVWGVLLERGAAPPAVSASADQGLDLEILLADAELADVRGAELTASEMLEDLEFYAWLDAHRPVEELAAELRAARSPAG